MLTKSILRPALILLALSAPLSTATVFAEPAAVGPKDKDTSSKEQAALTPAELQMLAHLHALDQSEVAVAKLAEQRATNPAEKAYAQMLVKDHQQNDQQIQAFAARHKVTIPAEEQTEMVRKDMKEHEDAVAHLRTLHGAEFDRAYIQMMTKGHDEAIAWIDASLKTVQNDELRGLLAHTRTTLEKHRDQAKALEAKSEMKSDTKTENKSEDKTNMPKD